jgi:hypothetical protein
MKTPALELLVVASREALVSTTPGMVCISAKKSRPFNAKSLICVPVTNPERSAVASCNEAASAVTLTDSRTSPICIGTLPSVRISCELTIMFFSSSILNPADSARSVYVPAPTLGKVNRPSGPDVANCEAAVPWFVSLHEAPTMADPVGSTRTPLSELETLCENPTPAATNTSKPRKTHLK